MFDIYVVDMAPTDPLFESETARLVANLRNLTWDDTLPPYHTVLPPGMTLPPAFYQSVVLMNTLTIIGYHVYRSLPWYSMYRSFLEYFAAAAYESEAFIWNQRGVMQSYYYEGLEWQRGSIVNHTLDRFTSRVPILSSVVVDTILALFLINLDTPSAVLWWGAEQQNFMYSYLLGAPWCWPVPSASNSPVFVDASGGDIHRFVFGPSTWLALSRDVVRWQRAGNTRPFRRSIRRGRQIWLDIEGYLPVNRQLLRRALNETHSNSVLMTLVEHATQFLLEATKYYPASRLTITRADRVLNNVNRLLVLARRRPSRYHHYLREAVRQIQHFYCGEDCRQCVFVAPRVACSAI